MAQSIHGIESPPNPERFTRSSGGRCVQVRLPPHLSHGHALVFGGAEGFRDHACSGADDFHCQAGAHEPKVHSGARVAAEVGHLVDAVGTVSGGDNGLLKCAVGGVRLSGCFGGQALGVLGRPPGATLFNFGDSLEEVGSYRLTADITTDWGKTATTFTTFDVVAGN